ncbi:hypothetical protein AAG570_012242 [Ranatra chinensis]|uniref:Protein SMG9 n=1 Tax=Ranatra chinensis TaxID=642074 RepID=A0ABD0YIL9_9HEMI
MVFPSHSTEGVDAFITPDRVILLDCQPLLAMSKVPRNPSDNSRNTNREDADFSVPENDNEIESLQYAAFIFSVCHVVLIVQDWGGNPDYMRFYHTAEMLKPATPTPTEDEELVEYFPHAMIIHTKTKPPYFSREKFHELQEHYRDAFALSNLQLHTGLSIANGNVVKTLNAKLCNGEPLNLYLLPPFQNENVYKGHLGYNDLFCKMRQLIFGVAPIPLSHTILTEKNW